MFADSFDPVIPEIKIEADEKCQTPSRVSITYILGQFLWHKGWGNGNVGHLKRTRG